MTNQGAASEIVEALILDGADDDTIDTAITTTDPTTDDLNSSANELVAERK